MRLASITFNADVGMLRFDFSDGTYGYQQFVLGCHSDAVVQALRKLADGIEAESRQAYRAQPNPTDPSELAQDLRAMLNAWGAIAANNFEDVPDSDLTPTEVRAMNVIRDVGRKYRGRI